MKKENISCSCNIIHSDIVEEAKSNFPKDMCLHNLAGLFKVLGDNTRIKIIFALYQSEMCVCDIAELLSMSQSAISHQLRVLRDNRLVKYRREGKTVFYSLDDEHVYDILSKGFEHICHE